MNVRTLHYSQSRGFSGSIGRELDSERTHSEPIVRTVLAIDEAQQSMTFAGDLPEGSRARLMHANRNRLVQGASHAAAGGARVATPDGTLAIAISCVGRRLVLGERTEAEIEATLDALPSGSQQVGFYCTASSVRRTARPAASSTIRR